MNELMRIDMCIPAFNEEKIIVEAAEAVSQVLRGIPGAESRLIVADNGSTDETAKRAGGVADVSVLAVPRRGKGAAVIAAAKLSQADFFGFIDADLSAEPVEMLKLLRPLLADDCDIAIGSRLTNRQIVKRDWLRTTLSRIFNRVRKIILGISVKDTQCGLKLMNRRGREVLATGQEVGWFFDLELLSRAEQAGLHVKEIPVNWEEFRFADRQSKLKLLRDGLGALAAMIRIYRRTKSRTKRRAVNGSILTRFNHLELATADEKKYSLDLNPLNRLALKVVGLPHLGFRLRARIILPEATKTNSRGKILDAGCGYGLYSLTLGELGYQVSAIDLDKERIQTIKRLIEVDPALERYLTLQVGSITALPFPVESYDTIICSEVIEHIEDDRQAIQELARVLKPGGRLILSVPSPSAFNQRTFKRFGHERPGYTEIDLEKILFAHGLTVERGWSYERTVGRILFNAFNRLRAKPLMGLFFYPLYLLYLLDYRFGFGEPNQVIITARKI